MSVYDPLSCSDIKMAATWRKAICPHLYTQVRSNENKSDWKHHILKGSRKDENCAVSFSLSWVRKTWIWKWYQSKFTLLIIKCFCQMEAVPLHFANWICTSSLSLSWTAFQVEALPLHWRLDGPNVLHWRHDALSLTPSQFPGQPANANWESESDFHQWQNVSGIYIISIIWMEVKVSTVQEDLKIEHSWGVSGEQYARWIK